MLGEVITAMVTPFRADGAVDFDRFRELAGFLVDNGSDGLVVCGTTGESPTLSDDGEARSLARPPSTRSAVARRSSQAPARTTRRTPSHLTERGAEIGVDGLLVVTPYYNKPPQRGDRPHFEEIAAATDQPVVAYNIPARVVVNIEPETIARLAEIPNVVAR